MGTIAWYKQITAKQGEAFLADPEAGEAFVTSPEATEGCCNIDASWQGIHFALTGALAKSKKQYSSLIFGGEMAGFGSSDAEPPRYMTPEEVAAIAKDIEPLTPEIFRTRCSIPLMVEKEVFGINDPPAADEAEYFVHHYGELRKYFLSAAKRKLGMMTQIF